MLTLYDNPARAEWAALTERCVRQEAKITGQVETILARIRQGGDRALREITREIEGRDAAETRGKTAVTRRTDDGMQLSFFQLDDPVLVQIRDQIKGLDINALTPIEALNKLNEIKKIAGI